MSSSRRSSRRVEASASVSTDASPAAMDVDAPGPSTPRRAAPPAAGNSPSSDGSDLTPPPTQSPTKKRPAAVSRRISARTGSGLSSLSRSESPVKADLQPSTGLKLTLKAGKKGDNAAETATDPAAKSSGGSARKRKAPLADDQGLVDAGAPPSQTHEKDARRTKATKADEAAGPAPTSAIKLKINLSTHTATDDADGTFAESGQTSAAASTGPHKGKALKRKKGASATDQSPSDEPSTVVENQMPVVPASSQHGGVARKGDKRKRGRETATADAAISDLLGSSPGASGSGSAARAPVPAPQPEQEQKKGRAVKIKRKARRRDPERAPTPIELDEGDMADLFGDSEDSGSGSGTDGDAEEAASRRRADRPKAAAPARKSEEGEFVPDAADHSPVAGASKTTKTLASKALPEQASKKRRSTDDYENEREVKRRSPPAAAAAAAKEVKAERKPVPSTARPVPAPSAPSQASATASASASQAKAKVKTKTKATPDATSTPSPAPGTAPASVVPSAIKTDAKTAGPGSAIKRAAPTQTGMLPKKKKPTQTASGAAAAAGPPPPSSVSLLANTLAMIGKPAATAKKADTPAAQKEKTPKTAVRVGNWFEEWTLTKDQQAEFDASAEERAAQRAVREAWRKTAVNLQASKDAYIVDSVRTRSIPLTGEAGRAHGLLTTGTTRDVVLAVHAMLGRSVQPLGGPTLADAGPWEG